MHVYFRPHEVLTIPIPFFRLLQPPTCIRAAYIAAPSAIPVVIIPSYNYTWQIRASSITLDSKISDVAQILVSHKFGSNGSFISLVYISGLNIDSTFDSCTGCILGSDWDRDAWIANRHVSMESGFGMFDSMFIVDPSLLYTRLCHAGSCKWKGYSEMQFARMSLNKVGGTGSYLPTTTCSSSCLIFNTSSRNQQSRPGLYTSHHELVTKAKKHAYHLSSPTTFIVTVRYHWPEKVQTTNFFSTISSTTNSDQGDARSDRSTVIMGFYALHTNTNVTSYGDSQLEGEFSGGHGDHKFDLEVEEARSYLGS